ncbi:MAG TPA: ATP/GTP-binding protein [Steroidobacteraceae bacterium]|nr:ATP/GTP-binding protein [Steroidobacteraceae bacterium]
MSAAQELKIVFTGPMGAGKTTAISAISDIPPVSTEVENNDKQSHAKDSTTVALDYGQMQLEDGTTVKLYGTPGQQRFAFMWEILCGGAMGIVLLIDGSSENALEDFRTYVEAFHRISPDQPFVIGVGRPAATESAQYEDFMRVLAVHGVVAPVMAVDVRRREDVLLLIDTLLCILEAQVGSVTDGH